MSGDTQVAIVAIGCITIMALMGCLMEDNSNKAITEITKQVIDKGEELCHNKEGLKMIAKQKDRVSYACFNGDQMLYKEK